MKISAFFNLIRWKNLLLIALMQIFIKFFLLSGFGFQTSLTNSLFYLLVIATLLLTASGYIINDIIDLKTDIINKPNKVIIEQEISISNAKKIYLIISILGIITGIYVSFKIEKPILSLYFIGISMLLYLYSKIFKGKILIGNIIVSLLLAFSLIIILIFDFPININSIQYHFYLKIQLIIFTYAGFSFLLNFIREIIKDIEDINGDYNANLKTFPILFGRKTARNFTLLLSLATICSLIFTVTRPIEVKTITFAYISLFIIVPLLYFAYRLWFSETKKEYSFLSKLLKIIILFGIISIPIISNYLKNAFN